MPTATKNPLNKHQMIRKMKSSQAVARKYRERTARLVDRTVETGVGAGAAFAVGFAQAKLGTKADLGPLPMPLWAGGVALALAATGMGGESGKYLYAGANGALCAWAAGMGADAGLKSLGSALPGLA